MVSRLRSVHVRCLLTGCRILFRLRAVNSSTTITTITSIIITIIPPSTIVPRSSPAPSTIASAATAAYQLLLLRLCQVISQKGKCRARLLPRKSALYGANVTRAVPIPPQQQYRSRQCDLRSSHTSTHELRASH